MSIIKECIRTVGRGSRGRGPLTQEQAKQVMEEFIDGQIGDDQMAMLMMLIRVRDETPEEIAGFVEGLKPHYPDISADFDWPLYAGKRVGQSIGKTLASYCCEHFGGTWCTGGVAWRLG